MDKQLHKSCPSSDKPWLKYYSDDAITSPLPLGSMCEELFKSCSKVVKTRLTCLRSTTTAR